MNIFGTWSDLPFFMQEWLQEGEKRCFRVGMSRRLFAAKHFLVFAFSTKSMISLFPLVPFLLTPITALGSPRMRNVCWLRFTSPVCHKGLSTYFFNKILLNFACIFESLWLKHTSLTGHDCAIWTAPLSCPVYCNNNSKNNWIIIIILLLF